MWTQLRSKLTGTKRPTLRFIYENWAVFATGIALLAVAVAIQTSLSHPAPRLREYLLGGILLLGILAIARPLLGILAGAAVESGSELQFGKDETNLSNLYFQDWLMTKDRIKHFDAMVISIRTQGVPVATAILAAALIASSSFKSTVINLASIKVSSLSLVFGASALLITAIGLLDLLHYNLLLLSVKHALYLENRPEFKGRLEITHKLTSPLLTFAHSAAAAIIYVSVAGAALYLAYVFK